MSKLSSLEELANLGDELERMESQITSKNRVPVRQPPPITPENPVIVRQPSITPANRYRGGGKPGRKCRPAPLILRDMRAVYSQPKERDGTAGQKALRTMFETDPTPFLRDLARLESAHCAGAAAVPFYDARPSTSVTEPAIA